jgi:ankyrin repeat protein
LLSGLIALSGNVALGANQSGPTKSLQQAAIDGDVEQIKEHIAKGADFNKMDQYGYTPLKRAIEGHHPEAAKAIIESGKADLNIKDRDGRAVLLVAIMNAELEVADLLIAKGADVKTKDSYETTALHLAVRNGDLEMSEALIAKGADVNATDKGGQTPISLAMTKNDAEMVALLKKHGAKEPVRDSLYGDYAYAGDQPGQQAAAPAEPPREAIEIDPNAIREQIKPFEGLAAALKAVDDKSVAEQTGWIQRRTDNRIVLAGAVERQFNEEIAFLKPIATTEKAEKTVKAIDELNVARKARFAEITLQLREQRRTAQATARDTGTMTGGTGRTMTRGARGRTANTGTAPGGYAPAGPYGAPGTRVPQRRAAAEVNEPVLDAETKTQVDAWLNANPEDKKALLEAVHQMNLVDLDDLRLIAVQEEAKKTAATLSGLMLVRQERVEKITKKWQEDDERMLKLQERYGQQGGMMPGRGVQPGMQQQQQQMQPGMRGGRRGR